MLAEPHDVGRLIREVVARIGVDVRSAGDAINGATAVGVKKAAARKKGVQKLAKNGADQKETQGKRAVKKK